MLIVLEEQRPDEAERLVERAGFRGQPGGGGGAQIEQGAGDTRSHQQPHQLGVHPLHRPRAQSQQEPAGARGNHTRNT